MKIVDLDIKVFDEYAQNHINGSFYQSSDYGKIMESTGYKAYYLGLIDDDDELIAASLILTKKLYSQFKYAYAPRGFLVDYDDMIVLKLWTLYMKKYFNKLNVVFIKVDPPIINVERNNDGSIKYNGINNKEVIKNLRSLDYIHMGFNKDFKTLKPRWNMFIDCDDTEVLYAKIDDELKYKIYSLEKSGMEIIKGIGNEISKFYEFVKDKHTRKLDYYKKYYQLLNNKGMFDIYFAKIEPNKYLEYIREELSNSEEKSERYIEMIRDNPKSNDQYITLKMDVDKKIGVLKNELLLATEMARKHPEGTYIAASSVIKYKNELIFLIDGIDPKYKLFFPNHYLKWSIIEEHIDKGFSHINLNGISGEFNERDKYYELYKFKKSFGSDVAEYIGEFNLVINKAKYFAARNVFKLRNNFNKEKQEKNTF